MKIEEEKFLEKLIIKPRLTSTHTDYSRYVGCSMLPAMFDEVFDAKYNKVNQYILDTRERIAGNEPKIEPELQNIVVVNSIIEPFIKEWFIHKIKKEGFKVKDKQAKAEKSYVHKTLKLSASLDGVMDINGKETIIEIKRSAKNFENVQNFYFPQIIGQQMCTGIKSTMLVVLNKFSDELSYIKINHNDIEPEWFTEIEKKVKSFWTRVVETHPISF
jgi:hypothetical protein